MSSLFIVLQSRIGTSFLLSCVPIIFILYSTLQTDSWNILCSRHNNIIMLSYRNQNTFSTLFFDTENTPFWFVIVAWVRYILKLSQRDRIDQSIAVNNSVINAIIGHMTQQCGIDNLFSGGNDYSDKKDRRTTIIFIKSNGMKTFAARSSTSTACTTECRYTWSTTSPWND